MLCSFVVACTTDEDGRIVRILWDQFLHGGDFTY